MTNCNNKSNGPKNLWAPWRIEYIENVHKNDGCVFCNAAEQSDDKKNLIVYRGSCIFVILNRFPYNNGHLMIVPYQHTSELNSLINEEIIELFNLLRQSKDILTKVMKPQGFNIGLNLGHTAGAGIDSHLHFHLVPRWLGDTNFMPVIGHSKVISEALEGTWKKISNEFKIKKGD